MVESEHVESLLGPAIADQRHLDALLARYRPYLRLMAEQAIGSDIRRREDASDVLQQTELEIAQGISSFRGTTEPEFSAWVKQILRRNLTSIFRVHRAAKRDVRREHFLGDGEATASVSWMQPAASGPSPSWHVMRGDAALKLAVALESLPEKQRDAVRMRHLDGMKIDEVASFMGITAGAAAGFIRRGIAALREHLQDESSLL